MQPTSDLSVHVLTTLHCNFACDYCFQGDHRDDGNVIETMSLNTAARVAGWIERSLDTLKPETLLLTFSGGEPLLNVPAIYEVSRRTSTAARARNVHLLINIITNGLLLTPELIDQLEPHGLSRITITPEPDGGARSRMRPLRGGETAIERIVDNIRRVAGRCQIAIGRDFDGSSVESHPELTALKQQDFADELVWVELSQAPSHTIQPDGTVHSATT
jgi:uncharacterized protein